jgi:membrane associated rhomboid family serine protease
MAWSLPNINSARIRSAVIRIPLATKAFLAVIVGFWVLGLLFGPQTWARLDPDKVFNGGGKSFLHFRDYKENRETDSDWVCDIAHRLSTYPFVHLNIFHTIINLMALTPLLEKFEGENGTLTTLIMFTGRMFISSDFLILTVLT